MSSTWRYIKDARKFRDDIACCFYNQVTKKCLPKWRVDLHGLKRIWLRRTMYTRFVSLFAIFSFKISHSIFLIHYSFLRCIWDRSHSLFSNRSQFIYNKNQQQKNTYSLLHKLCLMKFMNTTVIVMFRRV